MSVQKREWTDSAGKKRQAWRVRWQDGDRWRSKTFAKKADADTFDADLVSRRRLGQLAQLDSGTETLDAFMAEVWIPIHFAALQPKTQIVYESLYRTHIKPEFGGTPLREISAEMIGHWQAQALRTGGGQVAIRKALTLLGAILQRAAEGGRLQTNPARLVRKPRIAKSAEVQPLAPSQVEAIRRAMLDPEPIHIAASTEGQRRRKAHTQPAPGTPQSRLRDATLVSVLAYAGLRPAEALRLTWGSVREATLLVEAPKTNTARTVRLLAPLAADLKAWRFASGRPSDKRLIFPAVDLDRWRARQWSRALATARVEDATPYTLRHSFASLLIAEGRSVIYVARQLGHGAALTLGTYGHVIEELEAVENVTAEATIEAARSGSAAHELPMIGTSEAN